MLLVTRQQIIKDFGASEYLVKKITKTCQVISKQKRSYQYNRDEIIETIERELVNKRIHQTTRKTLQRLREWLLTLQSDEWKQVFVRLGNPVPDWNNVEAMHQWFNRQQDISQQEIEILHQLVDEAME